MVSWINIQTLLIIDIYFKVEESPGFIEQDASQHWEELPTKAATETTPPLGKGERYAKNMLLCWEQPIYVSSI